MFTSIKRIGASGKPQSFVLTNACGRPALYSSRPGPAGLRNKISVSSKSSHSSGEAQEGKLLQCGGTGWSGGHGEL